MTISAVILSVIVAGLLGASFGFILAIAAEKFKVETDPRVERVLEAMPGANCGGCGYPGCGGYAAAIVLKNADTTLCAPGGPEVSGRVAEIMGLEAADVVPRVAVCACQGDAARAKDRNTYDGVTDCRAAHLLQGGPKACLWGCLGLGTCVDVCTFSAIRMGWNGLPVVARELCTGCGACVHACPRGIMQLIPVTAEYYIACSSHGKGPAVKKACTVGCTACKLCEKKGPEGAIEIVDNIPVLDYVACTSWPEANDVCRQDCFVALTNTAEPKIEEALCAKS